MGTRYTGNKRVNTNPANKKALSFGSINSVENKKRSLAIEKMMEAEKHYQNALKAQEAENKAAQAQYEREYKRELEELNQRLERELDSIGLRLPKEILSNPARKALFLRNYSRELLMVLNQLDMHKQVLSNPRLLSSINKAIMENLSQMNSRQRVQILSNKNNFSSYIYEMTENVVEQIKQQ